MLPFAALGVFVGHLLTADTIGPAAGGLVSLLAAVSGTWFPPGDGVLHDIAQFLPSYWLVQPSHVAPGGHAWTATGWAVIAARTATGPRPRRLPTRHRTHRHRAASDR